MSVRTLHRRLGDAGLNYHTLLDDVRRELADAWMNEEGRSLSEIAFMLGFSELSAFTRAHQRWTGTPPRRSRSVAPRAP
jgi:AraC-like DNA-binding protein